MFWCWMIINSRLIVPWHVEISIHCSMWDDDEHGANRVHCIPHGKISQVTCQNLCNYCPTLFHFLMRKPFILCVFLCDSKLFWPQSCKLHFLWVKNILILSLFRLIHSSLVHFRVSLKSLPEIIKFCMSNQNSIIFLFFFLKHLSAVRIHLCFYETRVWAFVFSRFFALQFLWQHCQTGTMRVEWQLNLNLPFCR